MLGWNDLKQFAIPATWDAGEITRFRLVDGTNYDAWLNDVAQGLAMVNGELVGDPLIGGLVSVTDEMMVEYRTGTTTGFQVASEYSRPDPQRGATTGHMLPLIPFDRQMGWTWMMLRKARRAQLDADIAAAMSDVRDLWHRRVLTRFFQSAADTVGGTGVSAPFADGGTADTNYVPIAVPERGGTFNNTHQHYLFLDGINQANVETAVAHLWEHGHDPVYEMLVSYADLAAWTNTTNVTGYVPKGSSLIAYGNQVDLALVDPSFQGVIDTELGTLRMRTNGRIPTGYWGIYRAFGPGDLRNPLRVRVSEYGVGAVLLAGDHIRNHPLENAIMFSEFGVGIGEDRTAAVLVRNDPAAYADPTIS